MRISDWSADVCASVLCRIIGDVVIGPDVSIWYNCVLRADVNQIRVGARSNIQDGSVVHCDGPMPHRPEGYPPVIGEDVLIGLPAMVHGCRLRSEERRCGKECDSSVRTLWAPQV